MLNQNFTLKIIEIPFSSYLTRRAVTLKLVSSIVSSVEQIWCGPVYFQPQLQGNNAVTNMCGILLKYSVILCPTYISAMRVWFIGRTQMTCLS